MSASLDFKRTFQYSQALYSVVRFSLKLFQKKEYTITGSVYKKDYSYQLTESSTLVDFRVNDNAKQEVSDLYDIFKS